MLYVLVSQPDGSVLALLDRSGQPSPGWPVAIADSSCGVLLPADDGTVRVVCWSADQSSGGVIPAHAFAFDPNGRTKSGWPIDLPCCVDGQLIGRVIGNTLVYHDRQYRGDTVESRVMSVSADGTIRNGEPVSSPNCCYDVFSVGPDGIVYRVLFDIPENNAESTSELSAIGPAGPVPGFPIAFKGIASLPAFDGNGRLHVTVATVFGDSWSHGPTEMFVFAPDGREVRSSSGDLGLVATDDCTGIEGTCEFPAAPLVGTDGTTYVIEATYNSTTVAGLNPSGEVMPGWPYRSDAGHQGVSVCSGNDVCEGYSLATPTIGQDNVLYLLHAARVTSIGGNIVAVGPDGRVRPGWPVELRRPGAEFWSIVVGSDGTVYALAVEPESGGASSASILAIASDSTVLWTTTIIEP